MGDDILSERIEAGILRRIVRSKETTDRAIDLLVSNPMFSGFDTHELQIISSYLGVFQASAGTKIIHEGEPGQFMCILSEGRISISKAIADGSKQRRITILRPGRSLGEMSLIDDMPCSASAIADEDVTLLVLSRTNLERLTREHPRIGVKFLWQLAKLISQRLRQTTGVLLDHID